MPGNMVEFLDQILCGFNSLAESKPLVSSSEPGFAEVARGAGVREFNRSNRSKCRSIEGPLKRERAIVLGKGSRSIIIKVFRQDALAEAW